MQVSKGNVSIATIGVAALLLAVGGCGQNTNGEGPGRIPGHLQNTGMKQSLPVAMAPKSGMKAQKRKATRSKPMARPRSAQPVTPKSPSCNSCSSLDDIANQTQAIAKQNKAINARAFRGLVKEAEKSARGKLQTCQYDHFKTMYVADCSAGDCRSKKYEDSMVDLIKVTRSTMAYARRAGIKVKADACWKSVDEAKDQKAAFKLLKTEHKRIYGALRRCKGSKDMKAWSKYVSTIAHDLPTVKADIVRLTKDYAKLVAQNIRDGKGRCQAYSRSGSDSRSGSGYSRRLDYEPTIVGDGMMPNIGGSYTPNTKAHSMAPGMGAPSIGNITPPPMPTGTVTPPPAAMRPAAMRPAPMAAPMAAPMRRRRPRDAITHQ